MNVARRPPKNNDNAGNGKPDKQGKAIVPPLFTAGSSNVGPQPDTVL